MSGRTGTTSCIIRGNGGRGHEAVPQICGTNEWSRKTPFAEIDLIKTFSIFEQSREIE